MLMMKLIQNFWFWIIIGIFNMFFYVINISIGSIGMGIFNLCIALVCLLNAYTRNKGGENND